MSQFATKKTIFHDCLYPTGRAWTPSVPLPGMAPCLVDGQRFYAIQPNTGGARDLTKFSEAEAEKWAASAPLGAIIVPDIETIQDGRPPPFGVRIDTFNDPGRLIDSDIAFMLRVLRACRKGADGKLLGLYGVLPGGFNVFNSVILRDQRFLAKARASNDYIVACGLLDGLDVFCPPMYPFNDNWGHWGAWLGWMLGECDRLSSLAGRRRRGVDGSSEVQASRGVPA